MSCKQNINFLKLSLKMWKYISKMAEFPTGSV